MNVKPAERPQRSALLSAKSAPACVANPARKHMNRLNIYGILLAAGKGTRMMCATHSIPKQFLELNGLPLYMHSVRTMAALPDLRGFIVVVPYGEMERCRRELAAAAFALPWTLAPGGERRQDSVANALDELQKWAPEASAVLIHDTARPFASARLMSTVADALHAGAEAVIPGIAVVDTIKECEQGFVSRTPDRSTLRAVQTPQGFLLQSLRRAHVLAREQNWDVTDDAMLLERCARPVRIVEGEASNVKITNPEDLRLLTARNQQSPRLACTGFGYDVHRYGPGRPMKLGGVPIQGAPEVVAHSDGDVLLHALMDAILGCMGAGDIGSLFPDSDPALDGIESGILLAEVLKKSEEAGVTLLHADCTLIAQIPKIAPHREHIKKNLCRLLQLPPEAVSVKATTEEHLGFTGEKKGIKAVAVVSALRA